MAHISNHRLPNKDHTIQIENQHVMDQLSKSQLNPTIHELRNGTLQNYNK